VQAVPGRWSSLAALLFASIVSVAACGSGESSETEGTGEAKSPGEPKTGTQTVPPTPDAAAKKKRRTSKFPPEARRNSAPEGIAETALAVGAKAPALEGVASTTGPWTRANEVTALVFYRGDW
jgi:hypothetical protein